jgi:stress response protein SCP2
VTLTAAPAHADTHTAVTVSSSIVAAGVAAPALVGHAPEDVLLRLGAGSSLVVGLSWELFDGQPSVDLDCSALVFDMCGLLLDAAFYNNKVAATGSIVHSGDSTTGRVDGFDETVRVQLSTLPDNVQYLCFVVNAFNGGALSTVETAAVTVCEAPATTATAETSGGGGGGGGAGVSRVGNVLTHMSIGCGTESGEWQWR